ncbi:MAG: hypothetical protein WCC63_00515 [Candidatus Bathyarchaeia archaeon]
MKTGDYTVIGEIIGGYANEKCGRRVFAVLKGGYNHNFLGKYVKALLLGL